MKIVNKYTDKVTDLITSANESYTIPYGLNPDDTYPDSSILNRPEIILNVLSAGGVFQQSSKLEYNKDWYLKNEKIYLKPNEFLDREGFIGGNYNLRFDFVQSMNLDSLVQQPSQLYLAEVSPSRREVRLSTEFGIDLPENVRNNLF